MKNSDPEEQTLIALLKDSLICQLLLARVPQGAVQKIVKVDIGRVNRIGKLLKTSKSNKELPTKR
jgi:hypothetical protein